MQTTDFTFPSFIQKISLQTLTSNVRAFTSNHWGKGDDFLDKLIQFEEFYHSTLRKINGNVHDRYEMADDFYAEWRWEICYFNCLFAGFSELFAPKEVA